MQFHELSMKNSLTSLDTNCFNHSNERTPQEKQNMAGHDNQKPRVTKNDIEICSANLARSFLKVLSWTISSVTTNLLLASSNFSWTQQIQINPPVCHYLLELQSFITNQLTQSDDLCPNFSDFQIALRISLTCAGTAWRSCSSCKVK